MESQNVALVSSNYVEEVTKLPECLCMRPKDMNLLLLLNRHIVKVKAVNFDIREIVKILLPPSTLSSFGSCSGLICCSLHINHSINKLSFTQIDTWNIIMIFQFKTFLCVVIFPVLWNFMGWIPEEMRRDLHTWIPHNIIWICEVATPLLHKKKWKLNLYLDYIISKNSLIDEIALTMVTKMYCIHIGVLFWYEYWTTNSSKDLERCQMVFAYRGKLKFAFTQELDEIRLKKEVLLSVVDKKGKRAFNWTYRL